MNQEIKKDWVEALLSGNFPQGKNNLQTLDGKFCCLGVLCELAVAAGIIGPAKKQLLGTSIEKMIYGKDCFGIPPNEVIAWAGLPSQNPYIASTGRSIAHHNDSGSTFPEIAQLIEENL